MMWLRLSLSSVLNLCLKSASSCTKSVSNGEGRSRREWGWEGAPGGGRREGGGWRREEGCEEMEEKREMKEERGPIREREKGSRTREEEGGRMRRALCLTEKPSAEVFSPTVGYAQDEVRDQVLAPVLVVVHGAVAAKREVLAGGRGREVGR